MTREELLDLMLRCNGPQLDTITSRLRLSTAFLPSSFVAPGTRATAIMELVEQQDRLNDLEPILLSIFSSGRGPKDETISKGKVILILMANPLETERLRIDEEIRLTKERLQEGDHGRAYRVESDWAVRTTDISKHLLKYQPTIVHFSGHGSPTGDIIFENENGEATPVSVHVLADLFDIVGSKTECVLLNACYSAEQAHALAKYVDCVVGMEKTIGDASALRFAAGFYRALAFGKDYKSAFRLGCNEIDLASLPDAAVPHFTTRDQDEVSEVEGKGNNSTITLRTRARTWRIADHTAKGDVRRSNEDSDTPMLYPVWFGTDRQPTRSGDRTSGFSGKRGEVVHFGLCKVSVPKSHNFGSVGSSWWKRFLTLTDDRLKLTEISGLEEAQFWLAVRAALADWDENDRMAMLFIHGFNATFEEAAIRTAQMAVDLKIPGVAGFFSWPSMGKLSALDYTADEASIAASEEHITGFLMDFALRTDAERVDVIAHSMGSRGLLRAMQRIASAAAANTRKSFRNIIFAAPDEDSAVFRNLAKAHAMVANRATLYLSSHDRALASSGLIHKAPRAGYVPPVTLVDGMDVIEVTNVDLSFLGHGYYGAAEAVLYDMRELLIHDAAPDSRVRLSRATALGSAGKYWKVGV